MAEESRLNRPLEPNEMDTAGLLFSLQKFQHSDEANESTIQKLSTDESTEQLKITDIGVDCLEQIFRHLDLKDLLNVADSNKVLKSAADTVYTLKYARKWVCSHYLYSLTLNDRRDGRLTVFSTEILLSQDLKTVLQLLRCFGHLILGIAILPCELIDNNTSVNYLRIITYLNDYCAQSVVSIIIESSPQIELVEKYLKPFPKVKLVHFRYHSNEYEEGFLTRTFPNLVKLEYKAHKRCTEANQNIRDFFIRIVNNFPRLETLKVEYDMSRQEKAELSDGFLDNLTAALRLNPQLKRLELKVCPKGHHKCHLMKVLQEASQYLTQLQILSFECCDYDLLNFNADAIRFESVRELEMVIWNPIDRTGDDGFDSEIVVWNPIDRPEDDGFGLEIPRIPLIFEKLEKLIVTKDLRHKNLDALCDFIGKHPSIMILELKPIDGYIYLGTLWKIANKLPLLNELIFTDIIITIDAAILYLDKFKYLKKLNFVINESDPGYPKLLKQFDKEWEISEAKHYWYMKKEYRRAKFPFTELTFNKKSNVVFLK